MPADNAESICITELMDIITKVSGGVIEFDIHYAGELYSVFDAVHACSTGAIQLTEAATYATEGFEPRYSIFNVPLLFDDLEHCYRFLDTPEWRGPLAEKLAKNGLKPMPSFEAFPLRFAGTFKVNSLADLKGKEFRVMVSPAMVKAAELAGAKPIQIAGAELAVAMQTGMMDCLLMGSDPGIMSFYGYHRYMPYAIKTPGYCYMTAQTMVNLSWWNSLPADIRAKVEAELSGWSERSRKTVSQASGIKAEEFIDKNFKQGYNMSPELLKEWRDALAPLRKEMAAELGQDLFDAVERTK